MNKLVKGLICAGIGGTLLFAAGCNGCSKKAWDTETRPLALSTGVVDGNFNPFFYTAQNDSNMIANTQISMLTVEEVGEGEEARLICGQNEPTVVLDYKETMYTTKQVGTGEVTTAGSKDGRTEYEFVIKNGIKFSDGVDLTIHDVLFNLYVYLDPSYTGSSTIYSTDIQGLKAYRAQRPDLKDDSNEDTNASFVANARTRINALISWSQDLNKKEDDLSPDEKADLEKVKKALEKEIESDWTATESSWSDSYKNTHRFTATWQAFLFEHDLITEQMKYNDDLNQERYFEDKNNNGKKDDGELYYTTLDPYQPNAIAPNPNLIGSVDPDAQVYIDAVAGKTDEKIKEYCIEEVYNNLSSQGKIADVLTYYATAQTILDDFTNEERTKHFEGRTEKVDSISGITFQNVSGSSLASFGGKMGETYVANETYSVLKIVINGVDPKAIYNFSFPVAPLHYYSGTFKDKDYVAEAMKDDGTGKYGFGVEVGNSDFITEVLQATEKSGVPVGAGPYQVANINGNVAKTRSEFNDGSGIFTFVRNDNFNTVGTGIENAKIRMVQYKVLRDDAIMSALTTQSIDFAMPNATPTNILTVSNNKDFLASVSYLTGGYGYIGVNPKFIPEYKVRQAIMKAMDTSKSAAYYGTEFAEQIYRPMTKTSWAYPQNATEYPSIAFATEDSEITKLVEEAGYIRPGGVGVYVKDHEVSGMTNAQNNTKLKFAITIAGETTDHPAYLMLRDAVNRLNRLGFDVTLKTSHTALQDLAMGNLAVWAAAWSSSVDPDPYQIYHKDSNATSVLNWNYKNILSDPDKWSYEYDIVDRLSTRIDDGRATTLRNSRALIYADCLNMIMDLAVELPTYQRKDLCVYNKNVIDANSLVKKPSHNVGLFDKLWEIDYV